MKCAKTCQKDRYRYLHKTRPASWPRPPRSCGARRGLGVARLCGSVSPTAAMPALWQVRRSRSCRRLRLSAFLLARRGLLLRRPHAAAGGWKQQHMQCVGGGRSAGGRGIAGRLPPAQPVPGACPPAPPVPGACPPARPVPGACTQARPVPGLVLRPGPFQVLVTGPARTRCLSSGLVRTRCLSSGPVCGERLSPGSVPLWCPALVSPGQARAGAVPPHGMPTRTPGSNMPQRRSCHNAGAAPARRISLTRQAQTSMALTRPRRPPQMRPASPAQHRPRRGCIRRTGERRRGDGGTGGRGDGETGRRSRRKRRARG